MYIVERCVMGFLLPLKIKMTKRDALYPLTEDDKHAVCLRSHSHM